MMIHGQSLPARAPREPRDDTAQFRKHTEAFDEKVARQGRIAFVARVLLALAMGAASIWWFSASARDHRANAAPAIPSASK